MNKSAEIINYTKERLSHDFSGHGIDHAKRVAAMARRISEDMDVDQEVIFAAAYLHDTVDDKVVSDPEAALKNLQDFLLEIDYTNHQVNEVVAIIENMSFSKGLSEKVNLSLAGQVVQDADRLDALGAIGIMRTAYFGGNHGHPLHDPMIPPIDYTNKADYRKGSTVINHFYEKLLKIADTMNTEIGKQEAQRRKRFMEDFLKEFYNEWDIS